MLKLISVVAQLTSICCLLDPETHKGQVAIMWQDGKVRVFLKKLVDTQRTRNILTVMLTSISLSILKYRITIYIYIHTYMYTYINSYIHACMHAYTHTHIYIYVD